MEIQGNTYLIHHLNSGVNEDINFSSSHTVINRPKDLQIAYDPYSGKVNNFNRTG